MCGRFNLSYSTSDVSVKLPNVLWDFDQAPNFNIAPSQQISVVSELKGVFTGSIMQWGIPVTTSDGKTVLMSNTRIERILHKNKWNKSMDNICFIPASGFYEWDKFSTEKIPYNVQLRDSELFLMVGICRQTSSSLNCSILTCSARHPLGDIHDRCPVVLPLNADLNVSNSSTRELDFLNASLELQPQMDLFLTQVSTRVNSVRFNSFECLMEDRTQQIKLF